MAGISTIQDIKNEITKLKQSIVQNATTGTTGGAAAAVADSIRNTLLGPTGSGAANIAATASGSILTAQQLPNGGYNLSLKVAPAERLQLAANGKLIMVAATGSAIVSILGDKVKNAIKQILDSCLSAAESHVSAGNLNAATAALSKVQQRLAELSQAHASNILGGASTAGSITETGISMRLVSDRSFGELWAQAYNGGLFR
jgi:hypothetical protein